MATHKGITDEAADASIDQACRMLRLPTIRSTFEQAVHDASKNGLSYRAFIAELLMAECDDRARRRSERRVKAAGFPREKSLRMFDFDANPDVDPAVIHQLATCTWVKKGEPLCLIGDSGTGSRTCSSPWAPRPRWPDTGSSSANELFHRCARSSAQVDDGVVLRVPVFVNSRSASGTRVHARRSSTNTPAMPAIGQSPTRSTRPPRKPGIRPERARSGHAPHQGRGTR